MESERDVAADLAVYFETGAPYAVEVRQLGHALLIRTRSGHEYVIKVSGI